MDYYIGRGLLDTVDVLKHKSVFVTNVDLLAITHLHRHTHTQNIHTHKLHFWFL